MRFIYCVLISSLFLACGPQLPHAGEEGYSCRTGITFAGACNADLRCVDGTCLPCGDDGEVCCGIPGGDQHVCTGGGVACDDFVDKLGTCTTTCGSPGLACCDYDTCPNGGECVSGTCSGTPNPPNTDCLSGPEKHLMYVIGGDCSYAQVIFYVNNLAEAEACRDAYVAAAAPTEEVCALDQIPEYNKFCATSNVPPAISHDLNYCSDAQLQTCEQYWCSNCSWSPGDCP